MYFDLYKIVTVVDTLPIVTTAEASLNQTLQCNDRAGITFRFIARRYR
jgi:hypothetical protein